MEKKKSYTHFWICLSTHSTLAADASNVDECTDYKELSGPFRTFTYYNASLEMCDDHLQRGWYRFLRQAGRMMPTNCVPKFHCGTYGPGWLDGDHPMPQDGRVMRRICFHLEGECCKEWKMIQIRNCGNFMVYHLEPPPECPMRYCGDAVTEEAHILEEERPTVKEELTPTVEQKRPIVAESEYLWLDSESFGLTRTVSTELPSKFPIVGCNQCFFYGLSLLFWPLLFKIMSTIICILWKLTPLQLRAFTISLP